MDLDDASAGGEGPVDDEAVDGPAADDGNVPDGSRPVDRFRRTAVGGVLAAGLLGLRDALEGRPEREQTAIEVSAPTREENGPVEVVLDFDRPGHGIVVIRREPEVGG